MVSEVRVMHYVNQFFAGMGGEDKAGMPVDSCEGAVGPGKRLQALLGDLASIVVTAYCGDNYFSEHRDKALEKILQIAKEHDVQVVIAGPAFNAGRYGFACVEVCHALSASQNLYSVTGMYKENPGVDTYRKFKNRKVFLLPTTDIVRDMEDALSRIARFVSKLAAGSTIRSASEEGYIPRGIRITEVVSKKGAQRAVDMLADKLAGRPFATEIPIEMPEVIPIPPRIANIKEAKLALASTTGVHAAGNPYGFVSTKNTKWAKYSIGTLSSMQDTKWDVLHGGYAAGIMSNNPNYGVPLDVCRAMEREGLFARLSDFLYATTGNGAAISAMQHIGREMSLDMKAEGIGGVILVST